jgi:hypothetical protein
MQDMKDPIQGALDAVREVEIRVGQIRLLWAEAERAKEAAEAEVKSLRARKDEDVERFRARAEQDRRDRFACEESLEAAHAAIWGLGCETLFTRETITPILLGPSAESFHVFILTRSEAFHLCFSRLFRPFRLGPQKTYLPHADLYFTNRVKRSLNRIFHVLHALFIARKLKSAQY